jgi:hypothetical protein
VKPSAFHVVGNVPAGVTKKAATGVGKSIRLAFKESGRTVRLKGMRFIPSTKVDLGKGSFEVVANTVIEVGGQNGQPARAASVDSVVTIGRDNSKSQVVMAVKIPALERAKAQGELSSL